MARTVAGQFAETLAAAGGGVPQGGQAVRSLSVPPFARTPPGARR